MQTALHVDEGAPSQDSLVNNIEMFLKLEENNETEGTASATTDSTDHTMSYEGTEDSTSVDGQNIALDSDAVNSKSASECQNDTATTDSTVKNSEKPDPEIVDEATLHENVSCRQTVLNESAKPSPRQRRKLRWGTIAMRSHAVIPGDHPDTREGPPLTMDWEIISEQKMDIDGYEEKRPTRLKVLGYDLRMGSMDRLNILRRGGVKEEDINRAMESASITRKQRLRTSEQWRRQFTVVEEIQEKILRHLAKAINPELRKKLITRY